MRLDQPIMLLILCCSLVTAFQVPRPAQFSTATDFHEPACRVRGDASDAARTPGIPYTVVGPEPVDGSRRSSAAAWVGYVESVGRTAGRGTFASAEELKEALIAHGLDLSNWGVGSAKTVEHLFEELEAEETVLQLGARGVRRWLNVVKVRIKPVGEPGLLLVEARQIFPDGRERARGLPLSEKMFANEAPLCAARRGVEEELGPAILEGARVDLDAASLTQWRETRESGSYPSLLSHYNLHEIDAVVEGLPMRRFSTVEFGRKLGKWQLAHVWEWTPAKRPKALFRDLATVWVVSHARTATHSRPTPRETSRTTPRTKPRATPTATPKPSPPPST